MPVIASLDALRRSVDDFQVTDLGLEIDPTALAEAKHSLEESGLLLLGEVHGVRENPLLARALMEALHVAGLALEWPADLAPVTSGFLSGRPLPDHVLLWGGDGRITAGHLGVLKERVEAGKLHSLTLFDGLNEVGWAHRESSMAERILTADVAPGGTLVVAGNAHTPLTPTTLGRPLGARLAEKRPGIREIRIRYGSGKYYNSMPHEFKRRFGFRRHFRLHADHGELVLDLPVATEALVPHRLAPATGPMPRLATGPMPSAATGPFPRPATGPLNLGKHAR
jgi:hypothetical protein